MSSASEKAPLETKEARGDTEIRSFVKVCELIRAGRHPSIRLQMKDAGLSSTGIKQLIEVLSLNNPYITEIDLSHNNIGDEGAAALAIFTLKRPLEKLNLICNNISDHPDTSLHLSKANVKYLELSGNQPKGVEHF
jgi:Leucine-rich repeat (LRR) protein